MKGLRSECETIHKPTDACAPTGENVADDHRGSDDELLVEIRAMVAAVFKRGPNLDT